VEKKIKLNPVASFLKKNNSFAFYVNFNFYFFYGSAALLMEKVLNAIDKKNNPLDVPISFIEYLKNKNIIEEVANEKF